MAKKKTKRFQSNFTLSVVVLKWHHSSEGVKDGQRWEPYFSLMYYQSWGTKLQNNVLKPRLFSEERGERNKTVTEAKPGPQSSTSCHKQSSRDPPPPHLPPPITPPLPASTPTPFLSQSPTASSWLKPALLSRRLFVCRVGAAWLVWTSVHRSLRDLSNSNADLYVMSSINQPRLAVTLSEGN